MKQGKRFKTIVVDPPWPVKKIIRKVRPNQKEQLDYKVMTLDQIANLNIQAIADDNSQCFLWTTHAFLPHSFQILEKWGFKYQRTLTWDKANGMCLFGFHHRTEFAVMGYKGKIEMYPRRKAIATLIKGKSERHSAKPDEFYNSLSLLDAPRIDIFARKQREGWEVWGDEVTSDIEISTN